MKKQREDRGGLMSVAVLRKAWGVAGDLRSGAKIPEVFFLEEGADRSVLGGALERQIAMHCQC